MLALSNVSPALAKAILEASQEYVYPKSSRVKKLPLDFDIFSPLTITQPLQKIPLGKYLSPHTNL